MSCARALHRLMVRVTAGKARAGVGLRFGLAAITIAAVISSASGQGAGDCCVANGTPGCDDPDCEAAICAMDPFCCDTAWDGICADAASEMCEACWACVSSICSDCCEANGTPGCDVPDCQAAVCAIDPFCCDTAWDDICANEAMDTCMECGAVPVACCFPDGTCQDLTADSCMSLGGTPQGAATDCETSSCPIAACADLDGDSAVGGSDVQELLQSWGACAGCPADLDGDGIVSVTDLLGLLAAWGPCS